MSLKNPSSQERPGIVEEVKVDGRPSISMILALQSEMKKNIKDKAVFQCVSKAFI